MLAIRPTGPFARTLLCLLLLAFASPGMARPQDGPRLLYAQNDDTAPAKDGQAQPKAEPGKSQPAKPDAKKPDAKGADAKGADAKPAEPERKEPPSEEVVAARQKLDSIKIRLDEAERDLGRTEITDQQLSELKQQVLAAGQEARTLAGQLAPRAEAIKARLEQLGQKPAADAPPESPEITAEREARQREHADIDEAVKVASASAVQADQIGTRINDRRREAFANKLFTRSWSLVSPDLWLAVLEDAPGDLTAIKTISTSWLAGWKERAVQGRIAPLVIALVAALVIYLGRTRLAPRVAARNDAITEPTRLRRAAAATWRTLFSALPAALTAYIIYLGLDAANLLPLRIEPIIRAILVGTVFMTFAQALAEGILAPSQSNWRIFEMSDASAYRLNRLVVVASGVVVLGRVLEVVLQTIGASVATTIALQGVVALIFVLLVANTMRRMQAVEECEEETLGPYVPTSPTMRGPLRVLAWIAVVLVVAAEFSGFISFARFVVNQAVWIAVVVSLLSLALILVDETILKALTGRTRISVALQTGVGIRKTMLDQIAVLASGLLRLFLIIVAIFLILAPWGLESTDLLSSVQAAFFGIQVGGVTLSLSTVALAIAFFVIAIVATRALQRWLQAKYLPVTQLDAGLRNSITTGVGYLGVFAAAAIALGQLGLSLDKIAIVAGALSVGIGFGLQSIVNNFVSGLILLWERSIRVGDWIVVGSEQGYVKKISVRATEIQTFERAAVIVPNSNLVSGVVKNWLYSDRTGRITITVPTAFRSSPQAVADLLEDCARAHPGVLKEPKPLVLLNKFTDTSLEFELRCFADVEATLRIKSDLHFAIFERLVREGIYVEPATPLSEVKVRLPQDFEAFLAEGLAAGRHRSRAHGPGKEGTKSDPPVEDEREPQSAPPEPATEPDAEPPRDRPDRS